MKEIVYETLETFLIAAVILIWLSLICNKPAAKPYIPSSEEYIVKEMLL
jgi:hypothetical protein